MDDMQYTNKSLFGIADVCAQPSSSRFVYVFQANKMQSLLNSDTIVYRKEIVAITT